MGIAGGRIRYPLQRDKLNKRDKLSKRICKGMKVMKDIKIRIALTWSACHKLGKVPSLKGHHRNVK